MVLKQLKMKTKGGFKVKNFKKLDVPIERGMLDPHIYEGLVMGVTMNDKKENIIITWDKVGRCANFQRSDCFIEIPLDINKIL
jgi:hypothetical protein